METCHSCHGRNLRFILLLAATLLSGCNTRLADERSIELGAGEITSIVIEPVGQAQAVNVSATIEGSPIDVHVYLFSDEESVERAITLGSESDKILAHQLKSNGISLSATIPANQEASVRFANSGKESAKIVVSITN